MALGGNPVFANDKNFGGKGSVAVAPPAQGTTAPPLYSPEQLNHMYQQPPASHTAMGRMTYDDVLVKTLMCFGLVVVGALVGWFNPVLALPAALGGLVLGLVNSFKREPSKGLILAYAGVEGLFLGALSGVLEARFPGIVIQAVLGTFAVFAVTLALFTYGKFRATARMMKFFIIALAGYLLFSLLNFGLVMFGAIKSPWGLRSVEIMGIPLGVFIGLLAIGLAAFSLIVDFTSIEHGVRQGIPERYSWSAAFGLTVTLVWLYVEIIRLLAILRGSDN